MKVLNLKKTYGLTIEQIFEELSNGGRFVTYGYCISIVAMTFRLTSSPHLIRSGEKTSKYMTKYNILSLIFGWWGLPYGPIYTIDMVRINLKNNGIDITEDIVPKIKSQHENSNQKEILGFDLTIEFNDNELTK